MGEAPASPSFGGIPDTIGWHSPIATAGSTIDPQSDGQAAGNWPSPSSDIGPQPTDARNNIGVNQGNGLTTSAALYLYTFLATLAVLLLITGLIIARSIFIRRRNRRMIEEAIRNGTWVPSFPPDWDGPGRKVKVDLRKKPKLWEAFTGEVPSEKGQDQPEYAISPPGAKQSLINSTWKADRRKNEWSSVWPFAAHIIRTKKLDSAGTDDDGDETDGADPSRRRRLRMPMPPRAMFSRIAGAWMSSADASEAGDSAAASISMSAIHRRHHRVASITSPTPMRISALIKMPTPPLAHSSTSSNPSGQTPFNQDEPPLPHIELGIAEVILLPLAEAEEEDGDDSDTSLDITESDISVHTRSAVNIDVYR